MANIVVLGSAFTTLFFAQTKTPQRNAALIELYGFRKDRSGGQAPEGLQIFLTGFSDNLRGKLGWWGGFIPGERLQIIPQKLFVKAGLSASRLVLILRPETGGIGGQGFVNPEQLTVHQAEFELGVGDDDPLVCGLFTGSFIDGNADGTDLIDGFLTADFRGPGDGYVFIMCAKFSLS